MEEVPLALDEKKGILSERLRSAAEGHDIHVSDMSPSQRFRDAKRVISDVEHKFMTGSEYAIWVPESREYGTNPRSFHANSHDDLLDEDVDMMVEDCPPWRLFLKNTDTPETRKTHFIYQMDPASDGHDGGCARVRYVFGVVDNRKPHENTTTDFGFFCTIMANVGKKRMREDFTYDLKPERLGQG
ncbi:MAG: hypothetical protein DRO99_04470, partial [Candidatus Aenigmatarchaeota archaeon]